MKTILFVAAAAFAMSACTTGAAPPTAWGKEGVSMLDYRTDAGQCAVLAATATPENNGANTAGGINGSNTPAHLPDASDAAISAGRSNGGTPAAPSAAPISTSGSLYRDGADPDMVQRAATQQRSREMAVQRSRTLALKTCLVDRGYQEFALTPEQRQHLASLPPGSDERREYLYQLGTDPAVLKAQPAAKQGR
jgi:hypothetical protein